MPGRAATASPNSAGCSDSPSCYREPMSDQKPPPPPPLGIILGVILAMDVIALTVLASMGMLQRLSPGAQFYYGLMTFGFPVLVYFFLKRRRGRGE